VFTIPALIFLTPNGPAYFNYVQITMLTFAGGILGVLMMVPLRRALIVKEHGVLPYRGHGLRRSPRRRRARGKLATMVLGASALARRGSRCHGSSTCSAPRSGTPHLEQVSSRTQHSTSMSRPSIWALGT